MRLQNYKNVRVLVTGGSGFIGANLVRSLINEKAKVSLFLRSNSKTWRLNDVLNKTEVYNVDIANNKQVKNTVDKIKPQVVFHLAAYGAYPSQKDLMPTIQTNLLGTGNLLEALNKFDYLNFVNTGTSSEYGYKKKPMKETDLLEPNFFYAAIKASTSMLGQVFAKQFNKPVVTLRPFSIYGEWEEPGRFIPTIIANCLTSKTIKLVPGKQVRDFLYVKDLVRAYLMAGLRSDLGGEIINIGSGKQSLISQAAKTIIKLVGNPVKIKVGAYTPRTWDTTNWQADIGKANKVLKWKPEYSLEAGLKQAIEWYHVNLRYYEIN